MTLRTTRNHFSCCIRTLLHICNFISFLNESTCSLTHGATVSFINAMFDSQGRCHPGRSPGIRYDNSPNSVLYMYQLTWTCDKNVPWCALINWTCDKNVSETASNFMSLVVALAELEQIDPVCTPQRQIPSIPMINLARNKKSWSGAIDVAGQIRAMSSRLNNTMIMNYSQRACLKDNECGISYIK